VARDRKIDDVTGTETTGHEWDGIEELDRPLPRWWLWVFYATIVWAFGYWVLMPAWPGISGYTKGLLGYSNRGAFMERMAAAEAEQSVFREQIRQSDLREIVEDQQLLEFARAGGESAYAINCSQCHGTGAAGGPGYPNLNDDAWLWGGALDAIYQTILYGIRADHPETRQNMMMGFLAEGILTREQVEDVTNYVLSFSGRAEDEEAVARGEEIFSQQCVACHQEGGVGSDDLGAPALNDSIWLYGGSREAIVASIANGRAGVMPAWDDKLETLTIKQLAVYVHALGGGE